MKQGARLVSPVTWRACRALHPAQDSYDGKELRRTLGIPDSRFRVFELPSRTHGLPIYPNGTRLPLPPPQRQHDPLLSGFRFSGTQVLKSMIIYRIAKSWQDNLQVLDDALQRQYSRSAARPTNAPLAEQWAMRFMTETKVLPASVLNRKVNEKANRRKPGKKELRDLKDEPKLNLLPMVFTNG